ncbi:MAG: glycosyltransferase family 4 protein [Magnetococcus sp. YQC-5]
MTQTIATDRKTGFLTYDLQPFTVDCLARIAARLPGRLKAYPVFGRVDPPGPPFPYRPSSVRGRAFAVRKAGVTPEGLTASTNWRGSWACVWENDVVVLFGIQGGSALVATTLALLLRRPLISVNQTLPVAWELRRSWWILALKGWILRRCQLHVVQTPVSTQVLEHVYGIPKEKMVYAPFEGGVRHFKGLLDQVQCSREELRQRQNWKTDEVVFLFAGNLLRFKGIDTLMEAASLLKQTGLSHFRIVCLGPVATQPGEPDLDGWRAEAQTWGVGDHLTFPGPCSLAELATAYLAADVFLLPTRKDPWPKVLAEAALAGLPLVTTEACGAAHSLVINNESGFVIQPGDAKALAEVMKKLLDAPLRKRLGEQARATCLQWSDPELEVAGYLQALERVG